MSRHPTPQPKDPDLATLLDRLKRTCDERKKLFPEEAQRLHTRLEAEFVDRYAKYKEMAEAEFVAAKPSGELAAGEDDGDSCTLAGTAEHAGRAGADEACDDGRAG